MLNFTDVLFFSATFFALTMLGRALKKKSTNRRYPPSLPCLPIVGSLPFLRNFANIDEFFKSKVNQLGPIFTLKVGSRLILTLNSKEVIEEALVKNSACFAGRENFYMETLVNKRQKGIISHEFTAKFRRYHKLSLSVLREFGFGVNRLMETRIQQEFEALDAFIRTKNGEEFNPSVMVRMCTYNVIRNILLGKRGDYENGLEEIPKMFSVFAQNLDVTMDLAPAFLSLLPYFSRKMKLLVESTSRINAILEEDIEKVKKDDRVECFVSSYLAKEGPDYDHEQLVYTIRDLIGAGSETTSTTLIWFLVFLANNPSTQGRLQKEIDEVIPRHRLPSLDDQPKLPFVEAAILEMMRMRTAIPIAIPHITLSDSEVFGYFIPARTKVLINLQAAHMDPKLWKDPDVFRPDRFLDDNREIINRDGVISFSLGRRSCLGEILARQEIFLLFTGWIQRFDIQPGEDGQRIDDTPVFESTVNPRPFKIRMIPRVA